MLKIFTKPLTLIITCLSGIILAFASISIYIACSHNLESSLVIKKDGQVVSSLDVDNILIVPGGSSSYEVTLYSNLYDTFDVLANFEGEKNSLTDLINVSISNKDSTYNANLSDSFTSGYNKVATTYLDSENGDKFTITYNFSNQITAEMIRPVDLSLYFKISH